MIGRIDTKVKVDEINVDVSNRQWKTHPPHTFLTIDIADLHEIPDSVLTVSIRRPDGKQAKFHLQIAGDSSGTKAKATLIVQGQEKDLSVTKQARFIKFTSKKCERWLLSKEECQNPKHSYHRNDESVVHYAGLPASGVRVNRKGKATNKFGDGTKGVTQEQKKIAENEVYYHKWYDVEVNEGGNFIRFM